MTKIELSARDYINDGSCAGLRLPLDDLPNPERQIYTNPPKTNPTNCSSGVSGSGVSDLGGYEVALQSAIYCL